MRRRRRPTLFPYTTLFRSELGELHLGPAATETAARRARYAWLGEVRRRHAARYLVTGHHRDDRSEEHTSELQSRQYLVCRLLLEKKNKVIVLCGMVNSFGF